MINMPISIGEAIDKMTILEIKMEKLKDNRRNDCCKEYDLIKDLVSEFEGFDYYYKILRLTNLNIWDLQNQAHVNHDSSQLLYNQIFVENDRRFRIKQKINRISESGIQEQKGYNPKRCFIYANLGLGDMIHMIGAVRYFSTIFDEVNVVCKQQNENNAIAFYADDSYIRICTIQNDHKIVMEEAIVEFQKSNIEFITAGNLVGKEIYEFPHCFYDDFNIDRSIRTEYFYVPEYLQSQVLYNKVRLYKPYICVHQQSFSKKINLKKQINYNNILVLDFNENWYPENHQFYTIASHFVNQPLLHYVKTIENAMELHMIESSFYCLSHYLNLPKEQKKYSYLTIDESKRLNVFTTRELNEEF